MHHDFAGAFVLAADGDVLRRQRQDRALDGNLAVIVRNPLHAIARLASVEIAGIRTRRGLRRGSACNLQCLGGGQFAFARAVADGSRERGLTSAEALEVSSRSREPWPMALTRCSHASIFGKRANKFAASGILPRTYQMFM